MFDESYPLLKIFDGGDVGADVKLPTGYRLRMQFTEEENSDTNTLYYYTSLVIYKKRKHAWHESDNNQQMMPSQWPHSASSALEILDQYADWLKSVLIGEHYVDHHAYIVVGWLNERRGDVYKKVLKRRAGWAESTYDGEQVLMLKVA